MSDLAWMLVGLAAATLGMGCFALTVRAHWKQFAGASAPARSAFAGLRVAGLAFLGGSFACCVAADPVLMAILVWPMILMAAAGITALSLTVHAHLVGGARLRNH